MRFPVVLGFWASLSAVALAMPPAGPRPTCPTMLARADESAEETAADMGVPAALIQRLAKSDSWDEAHSAILLYRWLSDAHGTFFEKLAEGLALPYYSAREAKLRLHGPNQLAVPRQRARHQLLDDVLRDLQWSLSAPLYRPVVELLVTYPDVSTDARSQQERLSIALGKFIRFRVRDKDKRTVAAYLTSVGATNGMKGRQLQDSLTIEYLHELFRLHLYNFRREFLDELCNPERTVEELVRSVVPEFLQRHGLLDAGYRALLTQIFVEVFADAPPAKDLARELREYLLGNAVRALRSAAAQLPREAPRPANWINVANPRPRPVWVEPEDDESSRPARPVAKEARPVPAPPVEAPEPFETLLEQRKLSDLHHRQFIDWLARHPEHQEFVEDNLRAIFATKPQEWRHTRSLRQGLHELKVKDSLVRIYLWIGPGGLRVVEACEDAKTNSDYEAADYSSLRKQIRALTKT